MSESARTKFIAAGEKLYPELGYSKLSVRPFHNEDNSAAACRRSGIKFGNVPSSF